MRSERIGKPRVVIDTNTIISAPLSIDGNPARIFELLLAEKIINYTSENILLEILEVFDRPKLKNLLSPENIDFIISNFKKYSILVRPTDKIDVIKEDEDDNRVLECAIKADADYIISGDQDLLRLKEYKGIKILSPKLFYSILK